MTMAQKRSPNVKVVVRADRGTETFVIDQYHELRARGVGNFSTSQRPGAYRIKFRRGTAIQFQNRVLKRGIAPVVIEAPNLGFSSPAALDGTTKTHEYHMDNASLASRQVHRRLGKGSHLFLFTRAWTSAEAGGSLAGHDPATGLTLHDFEGNLLVDFEQSGVRELTSPRIARFDPWTGCNIEVNPGIYRIRLKTPKWGAIEQVVVASPNWQTQIFLLQKAHKDNLQPLSFRPDLPRTAMFLSPIGHGFRSTSREFRQCELARIALEDDRSTLAKALIKRSLDDSNPMLGLYVSHTLLASCYPDRRFLSRVVGKLRRSLGPHPDIDALELELDGRTVAHAAFDIPPMLRASWSIVMKHSLKSAKLVPHDSFSARISTHLWGDGIWLRWLPDELGIDRSIEDSDSIKEDLTAIRKIAQKLDSDDSACGLPKALNGGVDLTDFEEVLLALLILQGETRQSALVKSLGIPPVAFRTTARNLLKKLCTIANCV